MKTTDLQTLLTAELSSHQEAVEGFFEARREAIVTLAEQLAETFRNRNRLLVCGNGGSACDAMHIAGEFVGRFRGDREAMPAIALSADSGMLTAIGNDYGFENVFARQVDAYGENGDMLIALSTSGSSPNVLAALGAARKRGLTTVLLTGEKGRDQQDRADFLLAVPSGSTARIQEVHILILHLLASLVEAKLGVSSR